MSGWSGCSEASATMPPKNHSPQNCQHIFEKIALNDFGLSWGPVGPVAHGKKCGCPAAHFGPWCTSHGWRPRNIDMTWWLRSVSPKVGTCCKLLFIIIIIIIIIILIHQCNYSSNRFKSRSSLTVVDYLHKFGGFSLDNLDILWDSMGHGGFLKWGITKA